MEFLVVIGVPAILLLLVAAFLIVSQTTAFVQSTFFSQRQRFTNQIIQQYINQIALAQSQIYQKSKQLEDLSKKLIMSNQELERLNEMKSKFLSMVVHDVRTPLSSIKGFSELVLKKVDDPRLKDYTKNIVLASEQLGRLISDLTDLAMIEAGKLKIEKKEFYYPDALIDILPSMKINAEKKGVNLIVGEIPENCYVVGDKFRLSQVIMNLLNNAIKFTPPGKSVEIFFKREGNFILTVVRDEGIGIHKSEIKKIFEKFYQAKYQKDEKLKKQGWGLGLSIAQEIVRQHNGEIWAQSAGLGKGSTFVFKVKAIFK
ncbi:MAG: sensor histidine kinase [Elusimicrobiales bacterium]